MKEANSERQATTGESYTTARMHGIGEQMEVLAPKATEPTHHEAVVLKVNQSSGAHPNRRRRRRHAARRQARRCAVSRDGRRVHWGRRSKPHERPSIGVLLCATKDDEVVEYALARTTSPTLVAEYQTVLPSKALLRRKLRELYAQLAPAEDALTVTKPRMSAPSQPGRSKDPAQRRRRS